MTNTLDVINHSSVFTRDGECIALIMAESHDLRSKKQMY